MLTTPVIRVLKHKFPDAQIHYLLKTQFLSLLQHNAYVYKVHSIDSSISLRDFMRFKQELFSAFEFDAIVDLHDNLRSRLLSINSSIPVFRYSKDRFHRWLYIFWKIESDKMKQSIISKYFRAVKPLNLSDDGAGLDLCFPDEFQFSSAAVQKQYKQFAAASLPVTIAPGAAWFTKQWIPERFAEVCDFLVKSRRATVALLGAESEKNIARDIMSLISEQAGVLDFVGQTSILESARIIRAAKIHIANDSGLTHIARATGTPTLVVMGGTTPELGFLQDLDNGKIFEDQDLWCRPCSHIGRDKCPLGHFKCMRNIYVDDVLREIESMIGQ